MSGQAPPPPIFTFRGHDVGVTSLIDCHLEGNPILISGDEDGVIILWDLATFKKIIRVKVTKSRIQTLRKVQLYSEASEHTILIVQSRNNGIFLLDIPFTEDTLSEEVQYLASYPTYESLFSRGDALEVSRDEAILAYPSCIENHMVTVRVIDIKGQTKISGTAMRDVVESQSCPVFDIKLRKETTDSFLLFVAYENGSLVIYRFSPCLVKTIPSLNTEGLNIVPLKVYDLKIKDFISAFDVFLTGDETFLAVLGSPLNKLIFMKGSLDQDIDAKFEEVMLKKPGSSAISIRPDRKLVAVSNWDTKVRLYSMKSHKMLVRLSYHFQQVQDILFIERTNELNELNFPRPKSKVAEEGEYLLICASMEGTISVVSIY